MLRCILFVCLLICLPKSTDRPFCLNNKHFSHLRGRNGRWPIWDYRGIACCSQGGRVCSEHLPFQLRSRPLAPHWSQQLSFVQPGSKKKKRSKVKDLNVGNLLIWKDISPTASAPHSKEPHQYSEEALWCLVALSLSSYFAFSPFYIFSHQHCL